MKKNSGSILNRAWAVLIALTLILSMSGMQDIKVKAAEWNGSYDSPRHVTDTNGNVFLGGKYIEVGVAKTGSFGTSASAPSGYGFHSCPAGAQGSSDKNANKLGLYADGDGWGSGKEPTAGDFFTPGNDYEFWTVEYKIGSTNYSYRICDLLNNECTGTWISKPVTTDRSEGDMLAAHVEGKTEHGVVIAIDYSFGVNDLQYLTEVTVRNEGSSNVTDVYFQRALDPDQDYWKYKSFNTCDKVICNPVSTTPGSSTNYCLVVSYGETSHDGFFFMAFDNRARALTGLTKAQVKSDTGSYGKTVTISSLWSSAKATTKTYGDEASINYSTGGFSKSDDWITICFKLGSLATGASENCQYYSSLDPDVLKSVETVRAIAEAAEAEVSATSLSVDIQDDVYYALYTAGGTKVHDWILGSEAEDADEADSTITVEDGKLTFTGLTPDTEYVVRTLPKSEHSGDETSNVDGSTPSPARTAIDPMKGSTQEYNPTVTVAGDSITITGADPTYSYALYDSTGRTVIRAYTPATDGKVVFTGLNEGTSYILKAKSEDNDSSETVSAKTLKHTHAWKYTVSESGNSMTATCTSTTEYPCYLAENELTLTIELAAEDPSKIKITKSSGWDSYLSDISVIETQYLKLGTEDAEPSQSVPKEAGTYRVAVSLSNGKTLYTYIGIDESGKSTEPDEDIIEKDALPKDKEQVVTESVIEYKDGMLHFDLDKEHVRMYGYAADPKHLSDRSETPNEKVYLDLTTETISADFNYQYYSINGGQKWVKCEKGLSDKDIGKWFSKACTIYIADKLDEKSKKLTEDATVYYLGKTKKRPAISTLKVDYKFADDVYGLTNGQWVLSKNRKHFTDTDKYEFRICDNVGLEFAGNFTGRGEGQPGVTYSTIDEFNKALPNIWGSWPGHGGVWVPGLDKLGKNVKAKVEFRIAAQGDEESGYTPASKVKKLTVQSIAKVPKIKVDYTKETLKLKAGMSAYFGTENSIKRNPDGTANFCKLPTSTTPLNYEDFAGSALIAVSKEEAKKAINLSNYITTERNTIILWQTATATKPASAKLTILMAPRGVITSKSPQPTISAGKMKVPNVYQVFNTKTKKWGTSIVMPTTASAIRIRLKATAKGGAETVDNYDKIATGVEGVMVVCYGVYDPTKNKKGVVSAVIYPTQEDADRALAAYAAKLAAEEAAQDK